MPLIKLEEINHQSAWALWNIEEDIDQLKSQILPKSNELPELAKISHPQKQLEWMASRLAAQHLLQHFQFPFKGIRKDQHGKPFCIDCSFQLSLAHSFPMAVAIVHREKPIGIDVEQPRGQLLRLSNKFLNKQEQKAAGDDLVKLCLYWSAKETLYKIYGRKKLIFKENLSIAPFDPRKEQTMQGQVVLGGRMDSYTLKFHPFQKFFICYNL